MMLLHYEIEDATPEQIRALALKFLNLTEEVVTVSSMILYPEYPSASIETTFFTIVHGDKIHLLHVTNVDTVFLSIQSPVTVLPLYYEYPNDDENPTNIIEMDD